MLLTHGSTYGLTYGLTYRLTVDMHPRVDLFHYVIMSNTSGGRENV